MTNAIDISAAARKMRVDTASMAANADAMREAYGQIADARKAIYDQHIIAGFTPDQAFQLLRDTIGAGNP